MQILVTGGAGYIGSHLVKLLLEPTEHEVTVIDSMIGGSFDPIPILEAMAPERMHFYRIDLSDTDEIERIFREKDFDAVIHFAAHLQVGESVERPLKYYLNNTANTANLIDICTRYGVSKFIFSSTAAVYGEPEEMPISETTPTAPINPYGSSKLMSEKILEDTAKAYRGFGYTILRYFNVAGCDPLVRIGEAHEPETHLIPLIVDAALGRRESIRIFGDDYDTPDGTCIRDYVHVEDLARAHISALNYLTDGGDSETFNVGYGHGYSVKEVVEAVKKVSGVDFAVETVHRRAGDPAILIADNSKILSRLSWRPEYDDMETICRHAYEWAGSR
jgi:UDP-glucose 4-epimerase